MTDNFQLYKNRWPLKLFLFILLTTFITLLSPHMVSAQTALTYYSQNGYSKQLANFPDDIKFIDTYGRYITVVTEDNTIRSGFSFQTESGDIGGTAITGIPNVKSAKVTNNGIGVALTEEGKVWEWNYENSPQELNSLPSIKSIDKGISGTTYALDFDGNVWGWGENSRASLGSLGSCSNGQPWCNSGNYITEPAIIPGLTGIDKISAGHSGIIATTLDGEYLLVGTVCNVESNWPIYVTPNTYTQVSNIASINLGSCSLNSLTTSGEVYSWGVAGMEGFLMPNAKLMNPSFGPVKKIYSDNDRYRLALTESNDLYFYDYFGDVFNPPTEMFIRHIEDDSIILFPYSYMDEMQGETFGYITASNPENSDTDPPVVSGIPDRAANSFGWYNSDVNVSWISNDPEPSSGAPNIPPTTLANLEGTKTYTSDQSCDPAGNCATGSLQLSIDKTSPTASFSDNSLILRFLGRTISGSATDNISGIQSVALSSGVVSLSSENGGISLNCTGGNCTWSANRNSLPAGIRNYTLTVTDFAGNTTSINKFFIVL